MEGGRLGRGVGSLLLVRCGQRQRCNPRMLAAIAAGAAVAATIQYVVFVERFVAETSQLVANLLQ